MNNEENIDNKLKEILITMNNSETALDSFYELMEKETGGKLTFSSFKAYLDKSYPNINKLDRIFLLKHVLIDSSGKINLTDLFNFSARVLQQSIASPILAFYNIASIIEKKMKISTLEFIYKNGLKLEDEININDFYVKIAESLKIDDITTIIVFKGLDCEKKGKIRVEDFVIVIDSYREDSDAQVTSKGGEKEYQKLINDINYLKDKIEEDAVTVDDIYSKANLSDPARVFEIYNNIKFLITHINAEIVENVLNFLKRDEKIYKKDFELLVMMNSNEIDANYVVNYLKNKRNKSHGVSTKYTLNDSQIFWINKLMALLDLAGVTPMMAFETSVERGKNKEINLDNLKKKLQKMLPQTRVTAVELNNIAESLDINKTKMISFEDYNQIIDIAKTDPKFTVLVKSNFDGGNGDSNSLIGSLVKTQKNVKDLPVKGNTKALSMIKTDLNKTHINTPRMKGDVSVTIHNNYFSKTVQPTKSNLNENQKKQISESKTGKGSPSLAQQLNNDHDPTFDFIKDLEVFENGEWSLIELLEDINMAESGLLPTFDINNALFKRFSPTIPKGKISPVVKKIDSNTDGFVSYLDLISFLLHYLKHRSTKLALKEIARKIEFDSKITTDDFFSKKFLQPSMELNFVSFAQFFIQNFEMDPPVVKKIFDELRKILNNKSNILVSDIIDLINEYRQDQQRIRERKVNKDYNSISLLDKKFYEEEMKSFIRILHKGLGVNTTLIQALDSFLVLPMEMKLAQFREFFIKPLQMDFSLGIATFQLLRSFSGKEANSVSISKDDLYHLIESYLDPTIAEMDSEVIVFFLESNFCPVKMCLESIQYNHKGLPIIEVSRAFEAFYPKMSKKSIFWLCRELDEKRMGIVTFKKLSELVYSCSKQHPYSNDLIIKHLASVTDYKNVDTKDFILSECRMKKNESYMKYDVHTELLATKMHFQVDQSDNLFLFLCNNCPYPGEYIVDRLVRLVNSHRQIRKELRKPAVYDNSSQVEAVKAQTLEFTELLRMLNENINLSEAFGRIIIGEHLQIPVLNIFNAICSTYETILDLDKQMLIRLLKSLDKNKTGLIPYEALIKGFKTLLDEFEVNISLHCKYLANKLHKEYEGKWKDYLTYKGLQANKYISAQQFETIFKEECLGSEYISYNLFEFLKEKKGANANMIFIQNYIDYLTSLIKFNQKSRNIKSLSEEECEDIIKSTIYRIEKDDLSFTSIYDKINLKHVNQMGKINVDSIKETFVNHFSFDDRTVDVFINYFTKHLNLFDLMKLMDFIQTSSDKSKVSINSVINKVKKVIPSNKTLNQFIKTFNVNLHLAITLSDMCLLFKPLFNISSYECFFIFNQIVGHESNPLQEDFKISLDFFLQHFGLYKLFQKEQNNKRAKLDPRLINALKRFVEYLDKLPSIMKLFKSVDKDNNGVLSRSEFYEILRSCKEAKLNDSQMISILNFADKNSDDHINYEEFMEFIKSIRDEKAVIEEEEFVEDENGFKEKSNAKKIVKPKPKVNPKSDVKMVLSKIDQKKIKENYEFNVKNINKQTELPLNIVIFTIQEEVFKSIGQENSIEFDLMRADQDSKDIIPKDDFFLMLSKNENINSLIDEEIEEKLWIYSMEGFIKKIKNSLMTENAVNYRNFFNNITNFKVKLRRDQPQKTTKSTVPMKSVEEKEKSNHNNKVNNKMLDLIQINKKMNAKMDERNKLGFVSLEAMGVEIDLKKTDDIEKAQTYMMQNTFHFGKVIEHKEGMTLAEKTKFKSMLENLIKLDYKGYDYEINPEEDYFVRNGKRIETILTNEDAAIKKCEEIYESIKEGEEFFDKDFGSQPDDGDLKHKTSLYFTGNPPKGYLSPQMIDWYRMDEICPDEEPLFIQDGADANDVCQGAIGDCWFVSALSVIATRDHLLRGEVNQNILDDGVIDEEECVMLSTGVYPPIFHCFRRKNIYCFRFYKNFQWHYVIIDDRLPCRKAYTENQPKALIFGKGKHPQEFWVPLIEKAYAKLHSCYEALISGFVDDGMVDLTGLVARKMTMSLEDFNTPEKIETFWQMLLKYSEINFGEVKDKHSKVLKAQILTKNNTMMGCSIDAKTVESEVIMNNRKTGVLAGHAYAILDTIEIAKPNGVKSRKTSRLLRIRNPWGYKEWNGKWSDESPELENNKKLIQKALDKRYEGLEEKIDLEAEDGTFLMCFSDFRKLFTKLFVCIDFPNDHVGIIFKDKWTNEESGGVPINNTPNEFKSFANNPQYYLNLKRETEVYISLLQPDGRLYSTKFPYADITRKSCLIITKVNGKQKLTTFDGNNIVSISPIRMSRENSTFIKLSAGEYIISPCTFKPGETGDFSLEFHYQDNFTDSDYDDSNFLKKMQFSILERLGNPNVFAQIKRETTINELQEVKEKKQNFILDKFKIITSQQANKDLRVDTEQRLEMKRKKKKKNEEADYDEF